MPRLRTLAAATLCALMTAAASAVAAPPATTLTSIALGGSGCPQATVGQSFAADRQSATLIFDQFVASSGAGVPATESRKTCQISVNVDAPAGGWALRVDTRGYTALPSAVTAEVRRTGPDAPAFMRTQHLIDTFEGPVARDYVTRDAVGIGPKADSVPLLVSVRITGPGPVAAQTTVDSIDLKVVPLASVVGGAASE